LWRDLICAQDRAATPPAIRPAVLAPRQQVRLLGVSFSAYEQQLASSREQVTQVAGLKAESAESRERPGRNSGHSSANL
jgi:hypothetical protein